MTLEPVRAYRRRLERTSGILKNNPVIVMGLGLPFAVIASTTLKRGVLMSAVVLVAAVVGFFVSRALRSLGETWRVVLTCFVCVCAITGISASGIFPILLDYLGVYLPLAAANMMLVTIIRPAESKAFAEALRETVFQWIGFTLVMCLLAVVREVITFHTIWDMPVSVSVMRIGGAALPCFGFILLGLLAALARKLGRIRERQLLARGMMISAVRREGTR